jgi:hypothetical protein
MKTIERIGQHYGFSDRLRLQIYAWDSIRKEKSPKVVSPSDAARDLEKQPNGASPADMANRSLKIDPDTVATFRLMKESINYTSIDMENQCEPRRVAASSRFNADSPLF